jgi:hypothetical protein
VHIPTARYFSGTGPDRSVTAGKRYRGAGWNMQAAKPSTTSPSTVWLGLGIHPACTRFCRTSCAVGAWSQTETVRTPPSQVVP